MLYPTKPLRREMAGESGERAVLASLTRIVEAQWETSSRRVYGGGLYKVEPRELGSLSAAALVDALPGLGSSVPGQMRLELVEGGGGMGLSSGDCGRSTRDANGNYTFHYVMCR